jgi:hypothetical protein
MTKVAASKSRNNRIDRLVIDPSPLLTPGERWPAITRYLQPVEIRRLAEEVFEVRPASSQPLELLHRDHDHGFPAMPSDDLRTLFERSPHDFAQALLRLS